MHATHHQGGACPDPTRRADGTPETEADRRFFDLREKGWTGWITLHGDPTDVDGNRLPVGRCEICGTDGIPVHPIVDDATGVTRVGCVDPATCTDRRHVPAAAEPVIPAFPGGGCPECGFLHQPNGPCWYTECQTCAAPYLPGPITDRLCGTCDQVEQQAAVQDRVPVARIQRDAARYLDRHGWIQGAYYDTTAGAFTPAACLVGAIGMVCYGGPVDAPALNFDDPGFPDFEQALAHLDRYLLDEEDCVAYDFNDARGRTKDQVIEALYNAASDWDRIHSLPTLGGGR
jgi:hypothetical protein